MAAETSTSSNPLSLTSKSPITTTTTANTKSSTAATAGIIKDPFASQRDPNEPVFHQAAATGHNSEILDSAGSLSPPDSPQDRRSSREWGESPSSLH